MINWGQSPIFFCLENIITMSRDAIIGSLIIFFSLGFILYIVLWSRRTIERIKKKKLQSAREIIHDIDGRE
jgi:hypothetical protein